MKILPYINKMTKEEKEQIMEKWSPLLSPLVPAQNSEPFDDIIFPLVQRISARTIGQDLVTVQPMSYPGIVPEKIKNEVKSINRDRKIDSITDNKDFEEMKIEDHPEYNSDRQGMLFYLDFKYESLPNASR